MTSEPTRVLLVADGDMLAAKIEAMLRDDHRVRVLVGSPRALSRLIEDHDPAIVILASTAARAAAALGTVGDLPHMPPVLLLVEETHAAWTPGMRRAGVRAVLDHDATVGEISAAISATTAGLITLHPDVFRAPSPATAVEAGEDRTLTPRELEILEMMAEGISNQVIAHRLHISTYTVKFHVASILAKLRAGSRTEAVTLGVRRGLISL
jgi:DNA-binding NarL/FixJ family response regulator